LVIFFFWKWIQFFRPETFGGERRLKNVRRTARLEGAQEILLTRLEDPARMREAKPLCFFCGNLFEKEPQNWPAGFLNFLLYLRQQVPMISSDFPLF
jgi:hypothetical protein